MGTHPIFESDFDCLTETGLSQKCPQNSTPPLLSKSTSVLSEERLEPPPRSPPKLAPSVSPPKKSEMTFARRLAGAENHCQTHHPEQTGSGVGCSFRLILDHQG